MKLPRPSSRRHASVKTMTEIFFDDSPLAVYENLRRAFKNPACLTKILSETRSDEPVIPQPVFYLVGNPPPGLEPDQSVARSRSDEDAPSPLG